MILLVFSLSSWLLLYQVFLIIWFYLHYDLMSCTFLRFCFIIPSLQGISSSFLATLIALQVHTLTSSPCCLVTVGVWGPSLFWVTEGWGRRAPQLLPVLPYSHVVHQRLEPGSCAWQSRHPVRELSAGLYNATVKHYLTTRKGYQLKWCAIDYKKPPNLFKI